MPFADSPVSSPELVYLVPVIVLVPFVSILALALFLNWGR